MTPEELRALLETAVKDIATQTNLNAALQLEVKALEVKVKDGVNEDEMNEIKSQLSDLRTKMKAPALAITDENGATHAGCNVENAAYPEGICAEANAIGAMISGGGSKIAVIAVVGGKDDIEVCTPCGGCRQKIREFADANTHIVLLGEEDKTVRYSIDDLLPAAFQLNC